MSHWKRYIQAILLRQRGQNQKLVDDIVELLPEDSQERLFRILQDMENETNHQRRRATNFTHAVHSALTGRIHG